MKHTLITFFLYFICFSAQAELYKTLTDKDYAIDFSAPEKPTVLIVWASWCGYCMEEIPQLKKEYTDHPELAWLGLNVNKNPEDGLRVEQARELPWHSLKDPDLIIGDRFNVKGTPTLILLSQSGDIIYRGRRADEAFSDALDSASP